ncbi:hypothetical protein GOBAR_AA23941 [Gossypium barbadense]|uniref:Uncharacterized protein n=1 Tax=Gossypium barbadense TaxID=3634 RepID=A0A2P5X075_GOSBA|nr:hypothetical protein GOBAR_AA23941 [Gossypium barbadense]
MGWRSGYRVPRGRLPYGRGVAERDFTSAYRYSLSDGPIRLRIVELSCIGIGVLALRLDDSCTRIEEGPLRS